MARQLTATASSQITNKDIKAVRLFTINGISRVSYLIDSNRSFDKTYGSAQASFTLHNPDGIFSTGGAYEINVGDIISLKYQFKDDTVSYDCFYGVVNQRGIVKNRSSNTITLNCLDYISMLQQWDIDLLIEGAKQKIENEVLSPNLLDSPNNMYAQVFDFANDSLTTDPLPVLVVRDRLHTLDDPQYDGFEIYYAQGQVKFGFPLNVEDNYDVIARSYYFYKEGVFIEDALEQILTAPNGYDEYLFGETSAQDVIDNHLTDTFQNVTGLTVDTLTPNYTASSIIHQAYLTEDYAGSSSPFVHYKMNDNANNNIIEDSQGNYEGRLYEGTESLVTTTATIVSGKINRAIKLEGTDWNINCGDISELNDARFLSILFWLRPEIFGGSGTDDEIYFLKANGDNSNYFKISATSSDTLVIDITSQGYSYTATLADYSTHVTVDTFSHFKILFDFSQSIASSRIKLFIDNVEKTLTYSGVRVPKRLPNLAGFDLYIGYINNSLNGYLDDVRMYDFIVPDYFYNEIYNSGNGTENEIESSVLIVDSTDGFPSSGSGNINGDVFTYTSKDTTHFYGIPTSGENSLNSHKTGSIVKVTQSEESGKIWYLKYSNIITDLTTSDFTLPSGVTVEKFDKRYGRIYLSEAISISTTVTCDTNYSFKTLQASGIEINRIRFTPRDTENRFEAINKLRAYVAPNYVIRTQGDDKIWSSFLSQKSIADFTLNLTQQLNYLEDTDLYTRVVMYAKNKNPTNIMFEDGVQFITTDEPYKGYASLSELDYIGEEGGTPVIPEAADEIYANWIRERVGAVSTPTGYYLYSTGIPNAGSITIENVIPTLYIDNVPVDNKKHQMILQPVRWRKTTRTEVSTSNKFVGWWFFGHWETETEVKTYYYYQVQLAHHSIDPSQSIIFYNAFGEVLLTISANDPNMNYAAGVYIVPGTSENATIEALSTATYWVFYSTGNIIVDYEHAVFKINKALLPFPTETSIRATFEYYTTMMSVGGISAIIDGRWDTQVQSVFFAEPPQDYVYALLDLGEEKTIQAIDLVGGFYQPDEILKFDVDMIMSLQYSLDNITYYTISDKTTNIHLASGDSVKLEEDSLGTDFSARYLKIILEDVKKIEYQKGIYPVAISEMSAYSNIILKAEAKLIPTTYLTSSPAEQSGEQEIFVNSTVGFSEPESGETATAYIDGDEFQYTGLTETSFLGCTGLTESHSALDYVSQTEENDSNILDYDGLLPRLGDKLYKTVNIDETTLYTQTELNRVAKAYLEEFYKNHSKIQVEVMYSPHLLVGDTVSVTDTVNNINSLYFIESINDNNGMSYSLVLGKYPS